MAACQSFTKGFLFLIHATYPIYEYHSAIRPKSFRKWTKTSVVEKFPNAIIKDFQDSHLALIYINRCLKNNVSIELIITDFKDLGETGFMFAKKIRGLKKGFNIQTPILMLTMCEPGELEISKKEGILIAYLPKSATSTEILQIIDDLVFINSGF